MAKVIFLQVCVCSQGGGCLPQCMLGCHIPPEMEKPPPRWRTPWMESPPPTPGWRSPPWMENPPGWRTPNPPWMENPPGIPNPPGWRTPNPPPDGEPPPRKQTPAYGLRAAGTHPTGMHSCFTVCMSCTPPVRLPSTTLHHCTPSVQFYLGLLA